MKQNLLMEIINITNMMNKKLITESRVPILSGFDYGKMIDNEFSKGDIQVKNADLKYGDIAVETLDDLKYVVNDVSSKSIDELSAAEAKFFKEINTRFLSVLDAREIGESLKPRFKEIAGNDAARAQLKIDLDKVMSPEQIKAFGEGISPNKYSRIDDVTLKAEKPELVDKLKTKAPTKDEVTKIREMYDRGLITDGELVQSIKSNPTFKEGFSLYNDYKSLNKNISFTEYLIERGVKNPGWSANAGKATRYFANPFYNMINGVMSGKPMLFVKGLSVYTGLVVFGFTWDELLSLIWSGGEKSEQALQKANQFLDGTSIDNDALQERWKSYWKYDEPQILSKDGTTKTSVFAGGKNASLKNNPPTFERLTASETVGNVSPQIEIDGKNVSTVNFLISKTPVVAGSEKFSPDYIQLPSATKPVETTTTTVTDVKKSIIEQSKYKCFDSILTVDTDGKTGNVKFDSGTYTVSIETDANTKLPVVTYTSGNFKGQEIKCS